VRLTVKLLHRTPRDVLRLRLAGLADEPLAVLGARHTTTDRRRGDQQ
jgi:hypothetical protein